MGPKLQGQEKQMFLLSYINNNAFQASCTATLEDTKTEKTKRIL